MLNPFSSPYQEPGFDEWKQELEVLPPAEVSVREAESTMQDGRWMRWIQAVCESTFIRSVEDNVSKIGQYHVLLAEMADQPVGFCCVLAGRTDFDPLFIHLVAVVPAARKQGVGLALLLAAARWQPQRNIAMATLDENIAAQRLNERLAQSIGGTIRRVPVKRFRRSDLGFAQGERHRPWLIERTAC
ncbi:GNAT family N-acetyltransferase [Pseudarthrobacter phenanthrenivorans]|uniref:GNAT family N-acetyltransferase n=1 Tax=Pseudarthrobacter phenanthrenivorans TaxID=361575 RepID=UPI00344D04CE